MISADLVTPGDVCAVVVTYLPDANFAHRLSAIAQQVQQIIVVDNSAPPNFTEELGRLAAQHGSKLIENSGNVGIATALNQGLEAARAAEYLWAVTLDQDSLADVNMVAELICTLNKQSAESVALVGPNIIHENVSVAPYKWLRRDSQLPWLFERAPCHGSDMDDVTIVITSGALTNLQVWEKLGGFRDDFFIDYVDTEYCLRAKRAGYKILVSAGAKLYHRLGDKREVKRLGLTLKPTFHSPLRLYYVARNRVPMVREYALEFPHWFLFDVVAGAYNTLRILLTEDKRLQKLGATVQGTWDGLLGRMGPKR